jgi:hypothetical protein
MRFFQAAGSRLRHGADAEGESDPVVEAYKKDIDRTLIRENLKLSVEERFL